MRSAWGDIPWLRRSRAYTLRLAARSRATVCQLRDEPSMPCRITIGGAPSPPKSRWKRSTVGGFGSGCMGAQTHRAHRRVRSNIELSGPSPSNDADDRAREIDPDDAAVLRGEARAPQGHPPPLPAGGLLRA